MNISHIQIMKMAITRWSSVKKNVILHKKETSKLMRFKLGSALLTSLKYFIRMIWVELSPTLMEK